MVTTDRHWASLYNYSQYFLPLFVPPFLFPSSNKCLQHICCNRQLFLTIRGTKGHFELHQRALSNTCDLWINKSVKIPKSINVHGLKGNYQEEKNHSLHKSQMVWLCKLSPTQTLCILWRVRQQGRSMYIPLKAHSCWLGGNVCC